MNLLSEDKLQEKWRNIDGNICIKRVPEGWHGGVDVEGAEASFKLISQNECGAMKFQGFTYCKRIGTDWLTFFEKYFELFEDVLIKLKYQSACYFCFLGDHHRKDYEPFLEILGFKKISEYINKNDGPTYKQSMYIMIPSDWPQIKENFMKQLENKKATVKNE